MGRGLALHRGSALHRGLAPHREVRLRVGMYLGRRRESHSRRLLFIPLVRVLALGMVIARGLVQHQQLL